MPVVRLLISFKQKRKRTNLILSQRKYQVLFHKLVTLLRRMVCSTEYLNFSFSCFIYLRLSILIGLEAEGIFRLSGEFKKIEAIMKNFEKGLFVYLLIEPKLTQLRKTN